MDNVVIKHFRIDKDNILTLIEGFEDKLETKHGFKTITILEDTFKANSGDRIRYSLYEGIVFKENEEKAISNCSFSIEDKTTINNEFITAEHHLEYLCNVSNEKIEIKNIPVVELNDVTKKHIQIELLKEKTQERQTDNSKTYVLDLLYTTKSERGNGFGNIILNYGVTAIKNKMTNEDTMYLNAAPTIRNEENVKKLVKLYNSVGLTSIVNKIDWEVMIGFKEDLKEMKINGDESSKMNNQMYLRNLAYG